MTARPHILLSTCAGILFMAACSGPESESPEPSAVAVSFDVEAPARTVSAAHSASRTGQYTFGPVTNVSQVETLGIFGFSTGRDQLNINNPNHTPNLFHDCLVEFAGGTWSSSPPVYWPVDKAVNNSFFAYSPHSTKIPDEAYFRTTEASASSYPALMYSPSPDVSRQVDLLYARPIFNCNSETFGGGMVRYSMRHALVWINILVVPMKVSSSSERYTVRSLSFSASNFVSRGYFVMDTATVTRCIPLASSPVRYEYNVHCRPMEVGKADYASDDHYMMLVPQSVTREVNDPWVNVSFTFNNGTVDEPEEYFYSVPFPETPFRSGSIATYIVKISTGGASIAFVSQNKIEEWDEGEEIPVIDVF